VLNYSGTTLAKMLLGLNISYDKKNKQKMAVFWVVAPCSLAEVYRSFRGACCLLHQGEDPVQKRRKKRRSELIVFLFVMLIKPAKRFGNSQRISLFHWTL
jgi:hypothetical protein